MSDKQPQHEHENYQRAHSLEVSTKEDIDDENLDLSASPARNVVNRIFRLVRGIRQGRKLAVGAIGLLLLLLIGIGYSFIPSTIDGKIEVQQYYFQVYCPINRFIAQRNFQEFINRLYLSSATKNKLKKLEKFIQEDDANIDKYMVFVKALKPTDGSNYTQLYYCGYTRRWNETDCNSPRVICSIPGPLFVVDKDRTIDVAWVYDIDPQNASQLQIAAQYNHFDHCYNGTNGPCHIQAKRAIGSPSCTYLDPTQLGSSAKHESVNVSLATVPIGAHIHGLEVRPTFDGNPLSSQNMQGRIGVGYQSLSDSAYYSLFNNYVPTDFSISSEENKTVKINRYDNAQPPGNLWYHDHAMHATYGNVALGLAGGYIIYDKEIDAKLPSKQNEIMIIIAGGYQTNQTHSDDIAHMKVNPREATFNISTDLIFTRNQTYRFRILNGEFDAIFSNLRFVAGCEKTIEGFNFSNCRYQLTLSIIGADSTLFDKPINGVQNFTLGSAERIEFLMVINGGEINDLSPDIHDIYLVSDGERKDIKNTYIRRKFELKGTAQNTISPAIPATIGAPFYNLSDIGQQPCTADSFKKASTTTKCIAARRMRPLFRDSKFNFFINGHYKFSESGASENPRIGTTEDWFFINAMLGPIPLPHPMHIHLITFQVLQRGQLKILARYIVNNVTTECTFYEIDYYKKAGYQFPNSSNLTDCCFQIRQVFNIDTNASRKMFDQFLLENVENDKTTHLYGMEVEELLGGATEYTALNCPTQKKYKYVCNDNIDIPVWYKHWKEVVTIQPGEYFRVRIRWASTDYDELLSPYPYFKVPEDQLIEFPGFVYHCHFLQHEDNELMRPIMMQPSPYFPTTIDNPDLRNCMKGKAEGWKSRSECINQIVKCS